MRFRLLLGLAGAVLVVGGALPAHAYTLPTSSDWDIEFDNNISYGLGFRADKMDGKIANNPLQQNNEYKFPNAGNVTSNRFDLASELSIAYQNDYGADVSIAAWKDFAYNGGTQNNPGDYAPGVPYSALSSSPGGSYGSYTDRFYNVGAELDNAFIFSNGNIGSMPISIKVGRFTEYWGNAIFSGFQAISYGQSPIDIIKAVDAPGTEVKDLFMPRGQASVHLQVTPALTIGVQYQFEWRYNRFPEGGTFLGVADPFFIGPQTIEGAFHRGTDYTPPNVNGNFGIEALWSPDWLNGTVGAYFRQFDDPTAYSPGELDVKDIVDGEPTYHLAYAQHVRLYGLSLDHNIGTLATGLEGSIRTNTGLDSIPLNAAETATDPYGRDGARGSTLNIVGNFIAALTPTPLWQTGQVVGEVAYTHLLAITHGEQYYSGDKMNGCGGEVMGCATDNEANLNILFDPQWLQVFPGVDIDAPVSVNYGFWGNGQTLALAGTGSEAGSVSYSIGVHALVKQLYNIKLDYTGYHSPVAGTTTTPSGQLIYSGGSGQYMWNDKAQIQLTLSTAF